MKITVYHGTDLRNAISIMNTDFVFNANPKHWLGNGVYFFLEKSLAHWWTTKPSKTFGCEIDKPCIVKAQIEIPDEKVLDLRNYDKMKNMLLDFSDYFKSFIRGNSKSTIDCDALTSAFFNYYKDKLHYEIVICDFRAENQPYYELNPIIKALNIQYSETQICVVPTGLKYITKKEILNYDN